MTALGLTPLRADVLIGRKEEGGKGARTPRIPELVTDLVTSLRPDIIITLLAAAAAKDKKDNRSLADFNINNDR